MAKLYNGKWEGPSHFDAWARLYVDEDFDASIDGLARYTVAWWAWQAPRNPATAVSALLNQWARKDGPEAWDAALAWLASRPEGENLTQFGDAAEEFLGSISGMMPQRRSHGDTGAAADARDWDTERQAGALPGVLKHG
jgi:hypothetical protein